MSVSPLNRTTAPQILRLCSLCLKHGVLDAYEMGDTYASEEFLAKHKEEWTYGVLGEPDDYDWKMWRFFLYKWCRRGGLAKFAEKYLYEVKRCNYLYCPVLISMRFYLMGIEEWLAYQNPVGIEVYRGSSGLHWGAPRGAGKLTRTEIIADMQEIYYQYRRLPEERRDLSANVLNEFCSAIYDLTSKYVWKKKIRIDGATVENV